VGKTSPFKVRRFVYRRRREGDFAADVYAAYFTKSLAEAHVFVGRPQLTAALEPVPVTVVLDGHESEKLANG